MERTISTVLGSRWVPSIARYRVTLGFEGEKAEEVWMTEKQLCQVERCFHLTPHGHSTRRMRVVGVWDDRGYYRYAKIVKVFVEPEQQDCSDLIEENM